MTAIQHAAHASILTVAGVEYRVRRDMALALRIEERFGPLRQLLERLEQISLPAQGVIDLYRAMLAGQEPPAPEDAVLAHLANKGLSFAMAELHPIVSALFVGEEKFMAMVARRAAAENPPPPLAG